MSTTSQLHRISRMSTVSLQLLACLLLPLLCACTLVTESYNNDDPTPPQPPTADYINISIVVSSGNEGTTRAPLGGEDGDGREAGSERENKVTGITLMLYQDDAGINTANAGNIKIDYVQYFPTKRDNAGTNYPQGNNPDIEAIYTTGDQPLGSGIDKNTEYHVIVVANWDLSEMVTAGETTLATVRELATSRIYRGDCIGVNPTNFIMASEKDHTIKLSGLTPETSGNKRIYKIENAIRIERLAARVDFWMKGAEYNATEYVEPGYVYNVEGSNGDKFVLTAVTPFNLSDDKEFLIKRITTHDTKTDWSDGESPIYYLTDEKETTGPNHLNYVLDPNTIHKASNTRPDYMMTGYALDDFLSTNSTYESKKILLKDCREGEQLSTYKEDEKTGDNIIICYPKENTLFKSSSLYLYATGLCIEGYYYKKNESNPEKLTYYGFLRHQGEPSGSASGSYDIYTGETLEDVREKLRNSDNILKGQFPMNFSVVRNNIYRVSIDKITERGEEPPEITWKIKVKNWDEFTHDIIYM